jgi:hypothetical protein
MQAIPALKDTVPTFEVARDIFKAALLSCTKALSYFRVDGYVTEHVGLQSTVSGLYKHLADFEQDTKRAAAMHARQAQAIAPLLDVLNPAVYPQHHCTLSLESARAWKSCFEGRLLHSIAKAKGARQMAPADAGPVIEAAAAAFKCYGHFLRCYKDPRLPPFAEGQGLPIGPDNAPQAALPAAEAIPDESTAHAYFTAHFSISRIVYRLPFSGDVRGRAQQLSCACTRLAWIGRAAEALQKDMGPFFQAETGMIQAMAALLPQRIRVLESTGRDVSVE